MDYLIVANGPFLPRDIIIEAACNRKVIALDGAVMPLAKLGIKPDVILGDFDSMDAETRKIWGIQRAATPYLGKYGVTIVCIQDQYLTDLIKAIRYCDQHSATSIDIICAIGTDRIDHTLGNMRALRSEYMPDRLIRLHTDAQTLTFIANSKTIIQGEIGDYCGIVAFPSASFTSQGFEYDGVDFPCYFGFSESTCNRLQALKAEIDIKGEALIIHPGQLQQQKALLGKSYLEKFQMVLDSLKDMILFETSVGEWKKVIAGGSLAPYYISSTEKEFRDCQDDSKALLLGISTKMLELVTRSL